MLRRNACLGAIAATVIAPTVLVAGVSSAGASPAGALAVPHGTVCMTHHQFYVGLTRKHRAHAYRSSKYRWGVSWVRCTDHWAVATVIEGDRRDGYAYTAVEHRTASRGWHEVDRAKPCNTHRVPRAIYTYACESN